MPNYGRLSINEASAPKPLDLLSESSNEVPDIESLECIQGDKHAENELIYNISSDNSTIKFEQRGCGHSTYFAW